MNEWINKTSNICGKNIRWKTNSIKIYIFLRWHFNHYKLLCEKYFHSAVADYTSQRQWRTEIQCPRQFTVNVPRFKARPGNISRRLLFDYMHEKRVFTTFLCPRINFQDINTRRPGKDIEKHERPKRGFTFFPMSWARFPFWHRLIRHWWHLAA